MESVAHMMMIRKSWFGIFIGLPDYVFNYITPLKVVSWFTMGPNRLS